MHITNGFFALIDHVQIYKYFDFLTKNCFSKLINVINTIIYIQFVYLSIYKYEIWLGIANEQMHQLLAPRLKQIVRLSFFGNYLLNRS